MNIAAKISCIAAIVLAFCLIVTGMFILNRSNIEHGKTYANPESTTEQSQAQNAGQNEQSQAEQQSTNQEETENQEKELTYVATFNANGGTFENNAQVVTYEKTVKANEANFDKEAETIPTRDGRIFLGWAKEGETDAYNYKIVNSFKLTENEQNITYCAIWTRYTQCTVTFNTIGGQIVDGEFVPFESDENNGAFADESTTCQFTLDLNAANNGYYYFKTEANTISLGDSTPTKEGYKFVGWVKYWTQGKVVNYTSEPVQYFRVSAQRGVFGYTAIWEKVEA